MGSIQLDDENEYITGTFVGLQTESSKQLTKFISRTRRRSGHQSSINRHRSSTSDQNAGSSEHRLEGLGDMSGRQKPRFRWSTATLK
jgi:hypothetical protein